MKIRSLTVHSAGPYFSNRIWNKTTLTSISFNFFFKSWFSVCIVVIESRWSEVYLRSPRPDLAQSVRLSKFPCLWLVNWSNADLLLVNKDHYNLPTCLNPKYLHPVGKVFSLTEIPLLFHRKRGVWPNFFLWIDLEQRVFKDQLQS